MTGMAKKGRRPRQENEIFLKSILDNIPNMIFVKDAKDLRFVRFNKAGEKLLGRTHKDLSVKTTTTSSPKKRRIFSPSRTAPF